MSRVLDVLLAGGRVVLSHDDNAGIIATLDGLDDDAPMLVGPAIVIRGAGADIDAALDNLSDNLDGLSGPLDQRLRARRAGR